MKAWKNYTDNELDDFFKQEVLNRDIGQPKKDWKKLSESLKAEGLTKPTNPWKKYMALLGIALLFFTVTYFIVSSSVDTSTYESVENTSIQNQRKNETSEEAKDRNNLPSINETGSNYVDELDNSEINKSSSSSDFEASLQNESDIKNKNAQSGSSVAQSNKSIGVESNDARIRPNVLISNENSFASNQAIQNNKLKGSSTSANNSSFTTTVEAGKTNGNDSFLNTEVAESVNLPNESSVINSLAFAAFDLNELSSKDITVPTMELTQITPPLNLNSLQASALPASKIKFDKNLYLNLSFSPDFSAVVKNSFFKMGYNISAQLEYQFSPRWSVLSGVIQSKKHYNAGNDQISWPTNWGSMPKELKGMEGNCDVLDIPVNVRYNIKGDDRATMYIVGGFSNFVLLNEKYDYIYPEGMNTYGMKKGWEGKSGFLFAGMANLSLGYERRLTSNISFQVEPFVKAPLRDFGFTDVRLISTGVFLTGKIKLN